MKKTTSYLQNRIFIFILSQLYLKRIFDESKSIIKISKIKHQKHSFHFFIKNSLMKDKRPKFLFLMYIKYYYIIYRSIHIRSLLCSIKEIYKY